MQYKNVYVAYVSMGANPAATVKAFNEAENYNGPVLIIAYARRPLRSASPLLRNLPYELRSSMHLHRAGSQHRDGPISPERQRASRSEVATGVRTRRRRWTLSTSRSGATTRSPRARSSSSTPPTSPTPSPSHTRRPPRPLTPSQGRGGISRRRERREKAANRSGSGASEELVFCRRKRRLVRNQ